MLDITQASLIGVMILFPDRVGEVTDAVSEEWFTGEYRRAFRYISENGGSDIAALASAVGVDQSDVRLWIDQEFTTAFLPQHFRNLEREASMRKVQYLGQQLLKVSDIDEATTLIERFGNSLSVRDKTQPVAMKKALAVLSAELDRRYKNRGQLLGMSYGLPDLDAITDGLHKGDLVVVAGPSSMGKTAFALGAVEAVGAAGHRVLIFTLEMTAAQLLMRSLAASTEIPLGIVRSARFEERDWSKMMHAMGYMSQWKILIDDAAGITVAEMTRKIRRAKKDGIDLVMVDYLQIMGYDKGKENQELDLITTALKNLAKELDICIVLLSQLSRGSEKEKRKPNMNDLRGSGMIENNADVILFPYREAANCEKCRERKNDEGHNTLIHQSKAEVIIGKQRQGERNISVKLMWIGERTRFVSAAKEERDEFNRGP